MFSASTSLHHLNLATEANLTAYVRGFGVLSGAQLSEDAESLRLITPDVINPFFNSIIRTRLSAIPYEARQTIQRFIQPYDDALLPMMWWVSPLSQPSNLGSLLEETLFYRESHPSMWINTARLPLQTTTPANFRITRVNTDERLRQWIQVNSAPYAFLEYINDAFFECYSRLGYAPHAPLRHYIGWLDDVPVACSTMLIYGGVAGIYSVATLPEARGQGLGTALTHRPLLEARAEGCPVGILSASEEGYNLYKRLGFEDYGSTDMYVRY